MKFNNTDFYPTHTCFDDALDFIELLISGHPDKKRYIAMDFLIVHSICLMPDGKPYAHAWVEDKKGECIFRGILNKKVMYVAASTAEFYEYFKVQETTKYTVSEAIKKNFETESYGPWEEKYLKLTRPRKEKKHDSA